MAKNLYSSGAVVADNWTPPGMLGENPSVKAYAHDPAKARALLAAAGFPHGFRDDAELLHRAAPVSARAAAGRRDGSKPSWARPGSSSRCSPPSGASSLDKIKHGQHGHVPHRLVRRQTAIRDNFFYPLLDPGLGAPRTATAQNYFVLRDAGVPLASCLAGQTTVDDAQRKLVLSAGETPWCTTRCTAIPLVHTLRAGRVKATLKGFVPSPNTTVTIST